ncbi:MAG TPA: hypothetical protein VFI08_14050 [Spirochaetia bacterium]|nr:hypothetical protein [Spirochaetia bacterium]
MRRRIALLGALAVGALVALAGCSTLNVKTPDGMFLSTGDYVSGIKTLGVIQESKTVFAPLFIFDLNSINQELYERLIDRVKAAGADGITNVRFYWKPSPLTYVTLAIASGVFDFYAEGIAIKKQ